MKKYCLLWSSLTAIFLVSIRAFALELNIPDDAQACVAIFYPESASGEIKYFWGANSHEVTYANVNPIYRSEIREAIGSADILSSFCSLGFELREMRRKKGNTLESITYTFVRIVNRN